MKDDKNKVTPLFVNGELNDSTRRRRTKKIQNEKLPTKRFGIPDFFLSLIGLVLIGYGVYNIVYKNDNKNNSSNSNITSKENKNESVKIDYKKYIELDEIEETNVFNSDDIVSIDNGLDVNKLSNNAKLALASKLVKKYTIDEKIYILEEDLDKSLKNLFGDINYTKSKFEIGNNIYIYNQETKRYYLLGNNEISKSYKKYNYSVVEENDNEMIIKNYIAYTDNDNTFSITLGKTKIDIIINNDNIKQNYKVLKYYEYKFIKENSNYKLINIAIK